MLPWVVVKFVVVVDVRLVRQGWVAWCSKSNGGVSIKRKTFDKVCEWVFGEKD